MTQATIQLDPAPHVPRGNLREQAEAWMRNNPHVVAMFEKYAIDLASKGRAFGINLLRERVRWDCVYNYGDDAFKFQNTHSPYVARELVRRHPHLRDFMRFRKTKY